MAKKNCFLMSQIVNQLLENKNENFYDINYCPICESNSIKKIDKQWGIEYSKCKICGFIFSNQRLTDKGAYLWYNSDYYDAAMKTEHFLAKNFNKYFSISLNEPVYSTFFEIFKKYNFEKNIKIVDVGCGSGSLLHYLRDELNYTDLVGLDLNESNAEFAKSYRNINIQMKDIYDLKDTEKYDVVITTENIEHVSEPQKYLDILRKILNRNGYLFITTPYTDKKVLSIYGKISNHLCAPNHQNYFNFENLSSLLEKKGFIIDHYWFYEGKVHFNLLVFFKKYLIESEQVIALPPYYARLKTIFRWQKDKMKSVIIDKYSEKIDTLDRLNAIQNSYTLLNKIKMFIKLFTKSPIPIKFISHQIIVARLK